MSKKIKFAYIWGDGTRYVEINEFEDDHWEEEKEYLKEGIYQGPYDGTPIYGQIECAAQSDFSPLAAIMYHKREPLFAEIKWMDKIDEPRKWGFCSSKIEGRTDVASFCYKLTDHTGNHTFEKDIL